MVPDADVILIGFDATSTDVILFEQIVHRPLRLFDRLDKDRNGELNTEELAAKDAVAGSLRAQMPVIDLDGDKKLSRIEFQAGNFSNLGLSDLVGALRKQEAAYPRVADILKSAEFKVAFFHGLLDNQTPAYQTKAMELLAKRVWKKKNFRFTYFPNLGHALDKRSGYDDLRYDTISPEAKQTVAKQLKAFF